MEGKWIWILIALLLVVISLFLMIKTKKKNDNSEVGEKEVIEKEPEKVIIDAPEEPISREEYVTILEKNIELYCIIMGALKESDDKLLLEKLGKELSENRATDSFRADIKTVSGDAEKDSDKIKSFVGGSCNEVLGICDDIKSGKGNAAEIRQKAREWMLQLQDAGYTVCFYDDVTDQGKKMDFDMGSKQRVELPAVYKKNVWNVDMLLVSGRK